MSNLDLNTVLLGRKHGVSTEKPDMSDSTVVIWPRPIFNPIFSTVIDSVLH